MAQGNLSRFPRALKMRPEFFKCLGSHTLAKRSNSYQDPLQTPSVNLKQNKRDAFRLTFKACLILRGRSQKTRRTLFIWCWS